MRGILIDLGGVLSTDIWPRAAQEWSSRLDMTSDAFLAAVFGGSDHTVLIGQVGE
ncbi:MAG: hypothetical protein ACRDSE_12900 [Pseudonocardiaceae bacterium]